MDMQHNNYGISKLNIAMSMQPCMCVEILIYLPLKVQTMQGIGDCGNQEGGVNLKAQHFP